MGVVVLADQVSAPVTQWPLRILLVLVMVGVIALVLLGMRRGWRRRARSQADIPAPPTPAPEPDGECVTGVFLGTTTHGNWLDRVVVHDLGVRSRARIRVDRDGLALWREGARDLLIPAATVRDATLARGIAGKAYERDGVLLVTWDLGGRLMDTGLRADSAEDQVALLDRIRALTGDEHRAGGMSR